MRARRGALGVVCAVALTALAAACGGGADDPVADAPVDAGIPPPTGVSADRSAANAIAALGPPGPVDPRSAAHTLQGSDAIGGMRDVFVPRVRPGKGGMWRRRRGTDDRGRPHRRRRPRPPRPPSRCRRSDSDTGSDPAAPVAAPAAPVAPTARPSAAHPPAPADTTSAGGPRAERGGGGPRRRHRALVLRADSTSR